MKFLVLAAAFVGSVTADSFSTDAPVDHTVYNCDKVRQDVDEANQMLGDGVCNDEVNCGPFSYDLGDCWQTEDDVCEGDSWYTTGRPNFRCSTKTGGIRLGRAGGSNADGEATPDGWMGACGCYDECKQIAMDANETLVAFDHYSGKCRCWAGTCDYENSLPCFNGGDDPSLGSAFAGGNGDPDEGNNWRCPAELYIPELKYDCDGQEITFRYPNIEQYIGDGFCDDGSTLNQNFAFDTTETDPFNFNCEAFDYDGGDCQLDCHETIYWATDFVNLGEPFYAIDECSSDADAETAFTTACECYEFCAGHAATTSTDFLFDHDSRDMCRCFFTIQGGDATLANVAALGDATKFCGLNSPCQVYEPNREHSCAHSGDVDYTLGVFDGGDAFNATDLGDEVVSFDAYTSGMCVDAAMCPENSYSHGSCFSCDRFSTDKQSNTACHAASTSYATITLDDLADMVADGTLTGDEDATSFDGDNCACLNYCFSSLVEQSAEEAEDVYDLLNVIAAVEVAYSEEANNCVCWSDCTDTVAGAGTVWHSTVADLNSLE